MQQGDGPLGPLFFALVLPKFIAAIDDDCLHLILQAWYLDDGVLAGPRQAVLRAVWNSLGTKNRPGSPKEGQRCLKWQKKQRQRRRALFAEEAESYKLLKAKLSSLWKRDLCEGGDSMADSGEMASEVETKPLKVLTA